MVLDDSPAELAGHAGPKTRVSRSTPRRETDPGPTSDRLGSEDHGRPVSRHARVAGHYRAVGRSGAGVLFTTPRAQISRRASSVLLRPPPPSSASDAF